MTTSIEDHLLDLEQRLDVLPEADEPPPTMLQALGRSRREVYWQRLLVHFLNPEEAHGFGDALLEHFLLAISERPDLKFDFSRLDLEDVQIEREVSTPQGRPDIVIWSSEDWFICFELKVDSAEGNDQTERYVSAESFDGIGIEKMDVPDNNHHYVYIAPEDAPPSEANEFISVSWRWVVSELQSFLTDSYGQYPFRTTIQLNDFIDTIRSELTMTEYQENEQEKLELAIEHYEPMVEVLDTLEDHADALIDTWPDWFLEREPDGFGSSWNTRITNNRYKSLYRDDWVVNYDEEDSKNSDILVYWEFNVAPEYIGRRIVEPQILVTGQNETLIEDFREAFYRESIQNKVRQHLADLSSATTKEIQIKEWEGKVYQPIVSGVYEFESESADAFERTAVRSFEDLQPVFELVSEAMSE